MQKRKGEDSPVFKPNPYFFVVETLLDTNGQHGSPRPRANIASAFPEMIRCSPAGHAKRPALRIARETPLGFQLAEWRQVMDDDSEPSISS